MKTNRIPFTLKDYESGEYKVITRDGRSVRIVCTNCKNVCPIVALIKNENGIEGSYSYYPNGKSWKNTDSEIDLYLEKTVFEDGDIVRFGCNSNSIGIFKCIAGTIHSDYITLSSGVLDYQTNGWINENLRLATKEEKQRLFDALEKDGKYWNDDKKCIEKCELKPFQKVLVRQTDIGVWKANIFSHFIDGSTYKYICIESSYTQCIPFEGNEYLLGTTNKPKI